MRRRTTTAISAAALLLAACGSSPGDGDDDTRPDEQELELEELEEQPGAQDDPAAGLPDPNAMVEDGVFRGEGILLPAIDGWRFDPMALTQGLVLASSESGQQQLAGQAIDVDTLPEPLTFDELLESNRNQFVEEPTLDEEVDITGAAEAHQLRYDALPPQQEGQPETSLVLIVADDGDGRLAVFNYAAVADEYEDAAAERLLSTVGFDPDSEPTPPVLPELQPAPEEPAG